MIAFVKNYSSWHNKMNIAFFSRLKRPIRKIGPRRDLPKMNPLDHIFFDGELGSLVHEMPVLCYKQSLTPAPQNARVVGKYSDGSAACITRKVGNGRVLLLGGL